VHAVKRAKKLFPIQTFAKDYSVLLRTIHNSGPLRSFPHFSRLKQAVFRICYETIFVFFGTGLLDLHLAMNVPLLLDARWLEHVYQLLLSNALSKFVTILV
jgi:hypothetical protein